MTKKHFKFALKLFNILITLILIALLSCQCYKIMANAVFGIPNPSVLGFNSAVVLTGSMADTINPNDLIITKAQEEYEEGDIVTYKTGGTPVTHRIIEETEGGFITKGDANNTTDGEISTEQIIGKVIVVIPSIGAAILFTQTPMGMMCVVLLIGVILFLPSIINNLKDGGDAQ